MKLAGNPTEGLTVSVKVKNTGAMAAKEVIQVYVKAERENTPNAQLKGFTKVSLEAGEEKTVEIPLAADAFALCNEEGEKEILSGTYTVYVGDMQPDTRSAALTGKSVLQETINIWDKR